MRYFDTLFFNVQPYVLLMGSDIKVVQLGRVEPTELVTEHVHRPNKSAEVGGMVSQLFTPASVTIKSTNESLSWLRVAFSSVQTNLRSEVGLARTSQIRMMSESSLSPALLCDMEHSGATVYKPIEWSVDGLIVETFDYRTVQLYLQRTFMATSALAWPCLLLATQVYFPVISRVMV